MFGAILARVMGGFVPQRMNKSGTQSVPASQTNALVTGWAVDAGYPGTDIVTNANKITVPKAGTGKTVSAYIAFTGTTSWPFGAQLFKNGVAFGPAFSTTGGGTWTWADITGQSIAQGDVFDMRVTSNAFGNNITDAYLRIQ